MKEEKDITPMDFTEYLDLERCCYTFILKVVTSSNRQ